MTGHIEERAKQRVGTDDASVLHADLTKPLSDPERWSDFIEHVMPIEDGANMWRFRVEAGIFYVVEKRKRPVTIHSQAMMRGKKWKRKQPPKP